MKKYIFIIAALFFSSCNDFLDVKPESEVSKEELLSNEQGFIEALNGVYTLSSSFALYGGNLTFGNLDVMAQNYTFIGTNKVQIAQFKYQEVELVRTNNTIWTTAYRAIANCNNILQNIDRNKDIFSGNNYQIIKGEALTLRAYLHFDLLRMFAPSYISSPTAKGIPYVTIVSNKSTPFSTVTESLDKIIADLTDAKTLMKGIDPIETSGYTVGYPGSETTTELNDPLMFLQNRRHRMNYYAVCAELARVYLYKNDLPNSLLNATEVINSQKIPWTNQSDIINNDPTLKDRIFYKELITSWFVPKSVKSVDSLFSSNVAIYSATPNQIKTIYEVANVGANDLRYKQWFVDVTDNSYGPRSLLQKYITNSAPVTNLYPLVAPAIRLSEMYYIAAEASFDVNPDKAMEYFNTVRLHRGIGDAVAGISDRNEFINLLVLEARKEFFGESQIFFMHKRLNRDIFTAQGQVYPASNGIFVFPLPIDELAYNNN